MLETLRLKNIGPAAEMHIDFAPHLNLFTGDNGLGKSFLLDVAWWSLTRRWPGEVNSQLTSGAMARPLKPGKASIEFSFANESSGKKEQYRSEFDRMEQAWSQRRGRPTNPGLVLYAQVDGSFAVWDPHRNYWRTEAAGGGQERMPAYVFSAREIWDGLRVGETPVCNGLLADWALWQKEGGLDFGRLTSVLEALSPTSSERLRPGSLTKLTLDDARWMPTLRTAYGTEVPVLLASAAVKRILALAYLIVWSWQEHTRAATLLDKTPTNQITFLIDEVECHLHPRWQRTIIQALLSAVRGLAGEASVQLIAATHSPLVLASVEPFFDASQDAWFDLELRDSTVVLERKHFVPQGDVSNWLTSDAFDLKAARSLESENAIEQAKALLRRELPVEAASRINEALIRYLPDIDPFLARWMAFYDELGPRV
jgi:hypothetical protein